MIGCLLIPQYLSQSEQLNLLESALARYTLPPNPLSLSTHYELPPDLFELYIHNSSQLIEPIHPAQERSHTGEIRSGNTRQTIDTEAASVLGYEEIIARNKTWQGDVPSDKLRTKTAEQLLIDIRWANLGWVYQVRLMAGTSKVSGR